MCQEPELCLQAWLLRVDSSHSLTDRCCKQTVKVTSAGLHRTPEFAGRQLAVLKPQGPKGSTADAVQPKSSVSVDSL